MGQPRCRNSWLRVVGNRRPDGAALAILDPVSWRVISLAEPLPDIHAHVDVHGDGSSRLTHADADELGHPFDEAQFLEETDVCRDADPTATPRPETPLIAGEWREGGAMACAGYDERFGVRAEFLLGALSGCEALVGEGDATIVGKTVSVVNPDGDQVRLLISWAGSKCVHGATVALHPGDGAYDVQIISTERPCERPGTPLINDVLHTPYEVTFYLVEPIDASSVRAAIDRLNQ